MESFGGSQSSPLYGALGSWLEQFHSAFDPSAILDDAARHAFCDNNDGSNGMGAASTDAAGGKGGTSSNNTSNSKQRGPPPSPEGSPDHRRRASKGAGLHDNKDAKDDAEDGLDAIAKSRARITANRIENRRLSIGRTRATILTRNGGGGSRSNSKNSSSPAASTTQHRSFGYGYGGSYTDYSTSMDSGDVYLTEVDDEDFDEDFDDEEEETVPTTSGGGGASNNNAAKGKSKQLAASSPFSPGKGMLASKKLLSQAASLVGCGSGAAHDADGDDDDEGKDEREERRGGGGGGGGGGGFRGLSAVDPCGAGAARCGSNGGSDRDMAPSSPPPPPATTNTTATIIDLSAYEALEAPYDHLLERVAVMTLQMEKMRDEFDQMRTENAVLLENLTLAGDAAAHVGLADRDGKGLSEDDDEEDDDDRRMVGAEYDDYYEDGHEEEGRYPTAIRRF
jgi:hypothetical protein